MLLTPNDSASILWTYKEALYCDLAQPVLKCSPAFSKLYSYQLVTSFLAPFATPTLHPTLPPSSNKPIKPVLWLGLKEQCSSRIIKCLWSCDCHVFDLQNIAPNIFSFSCLLSPSLSMDFPWLAYSLQFENSSWQAVKMQNVTSVTRIHLLNVVFFINTVMKGMKLACVRQGENTWWWSLPSWVFIYH